MVALDPAPPPERRESVGFETHAHAPRPETAALSRVAFRTIESFCQICPNRFDQSRPSSRRASIFCSRRAWKPSCVTRSRSSPLHLSWSSPIGTPWRTAPALFGCILRRQHRRLWRYARARTARRLGETHCLCYPRYPRIGEALDAA